MSYEVIEIPCLGRPFKPGMLYDCRSDRLISTLTLWDPEKLKSELNTQVQPYTNCEMILEDTLREKSSKLGVDANVKLSLLGGMLSVSGSAHYLNDRKKSTKQVRISLKYSTLSRFDELTMAHFGPGDVQHLQIFDTDVATHVVTGVLYGADAVFIFDQDVGTSQEINEVGGSLQIAVNFVIGSIKGGAKVDFTEGEKEQYNKIRCTFYGDFHLKQSPCNLYDAINVYRDLPSLIQEKGTVPKRVWLYPLVKLDRRAAKLVRQISLNLVTQTEIFLEGLHEAEMKSNDILQSCHPMFDGLKLQTENFKRSLSEFKMGFQGQLLSILPKIRGGGTEEQVLVELLEDIQRTPFTPALLQQWLKGKQREVDMLNYVISQLKDTLKSDNIRIVFKQSEVDKTFQNFKNDLVLGLAFNVGRRPDSFLDHLNNYLRVGNKAINVDDNPHNLFQYESVVTNVRNISITFIKFVEANLKSNAVQFIVYAEETNTDDHYAHILLHNLSEGKKCEFMPPSAPGKPSIKHIERTSEKSADATVLISWEKPKQGFKNVTAFKVQYMDSGNKDWNQSKEYDTTNSNANASVQGLKLQQTYIFRVCSICWAGISEFSEVSNPIQIVPVANQPTPNQITPTPKPVSVDEKDNWVDVVHNAPFPHDAVRVFDLELQGGNNTMQNSFVALWFKNNEPCYGRAWNNNGRVEAWFPWGGKEWHSSVCGTFCILTNNSHKNYQWVQPNNARSPGYQLVSTDGDLCSAVVSNISAIGFNGNWLLGKASLKRHTAWTCYNRKELVHTGQQFDNQTHVLVRVT